MIIILQVLMVIISYLIGSIPFAYIVVRLAKGVDIRNVGSGNVGATNAARILGKWGFVVVFILDFLKGYVPTMIALQNFGHHDVTLIVGLVAIIGHTFTVFLSFKGGKGVATAAGVFIALAPVETGIAIVFFLAVFLVTRMVSAGSVVAAVALFVSVLLISDWGILKIFAALIAIFVIYKHRSNIMRIIRGEENKFLWKKKK